MYLKHLGGSELLIGLALAAFSATSFSLRPLIGFLTDEWRVAGVLAGGVLALGLGGFALLVPWIWLIFLSNAFRGIGWAALNTAGGTLLAYTAPPTRRAEASGYLTMFQSAALALSSPLALWLAGLRPGDFNVIFLLSGVSGLAAALVARAIPEPLAGHRAFPKMSRLGLGRMGQMLDRSVLLPMLLLTCLQLCFPALTAFVALYAQQLGLGASAAVWYFAANGLAAVLARFSLGRLLDRLNRALASAIGFAIVTLSVALLVVASNVWLLIAAGVVYAVGYAISSAGLTALAIDMANPRRLGAAMATYSMSNQLGVGIGSAVSGAIIQFAGYRVMYGAMLLPGIAALAALWIVRGRLSAGRL